MSGFMGDAKIPVNEVSLPIRPPSEDGEPERLLRVKQYNNTITTDAKSPTKQSARRISGTSIKSFFSPLNGSVLMVHGSCASLEQYEKLVEILYPFLKKKNFVAEAFDAFGCGKSAKPKRTKAYAERELQADLAAIYEKVKHPTTNFIIGHSYGTSQVIKLINEMSDEDKKAVKGVILLSGAFPGTNGGHPIFILPSMFLDLIQGFLSSQFRAAAYHPTADPALLEAAADRSNANPMYMCKYFYEQTKWATYDEIQGVTCRTLVVHGEGDNILSLDAGRRLHSALPNASFKVMPNVSHQLMEEDPETLANHIIEFMTESLK
mmetsp:Transcript_26177/g.52204  ORF Transcript_26177/g.52204 Transcript_26177/m.52204 type:complete len:321 (-) Transcript_26177:90-1052(-)